MSGNISTEDLSQCGSPYKILQDKSKFCFGLDAILLADFAKGTRGKKLCDLCTGNGIIPILLANKIKAEEIHGLELQKEMADLAKESIRLNRLENRIKIFEGNLEEACTILQKNTYDAITVNPPYMKNNPSIKETPKAIARQEIYCTLEDVIKASSDLLKSNGRLFMIHRPIRLSEIFVLFEKYNLGARKMRLVQPKENEKPTMVLIEAEKCARPELMVQQALIVYSSNGTYTEEVNEIYGRNQ